MDEFQKKLKKARQHRWKSFSESSSDEKLFRLGLICHEKAKEDVHLAVNLKDFRDNFDSRVFELISKAQSTPDNYYRLMLAFPEYVKLWEEWQNCINDKEEKDFFNKY